MPATSLLTVPPTPSRKPGADAWFLSLLTLCIIAAACFLFFTNNRFDARCHADEPGKVWQIQTQARNYNHPMLMLNTAQAVCALSGMKPEPQKIVWLGRMTVAVFSTLTVLAFAYAGFLTAGRVASVLCALFLLASPLLMELSHYFKEDPAMMMGIGLSFLAIALYQRKPGIGNLLLLACGAALSCSGKHLGAVILPFCVYNILKEGGGDAKRHLIFFLAVTLGLYGFINYQATVHFWKFVGGINREVVAIKDGGQTRPVHPPSVFLPLGKYIDLIRGNLPLPLLWFFGFGIYSFIKKRPQKTLLGQVLIFAAVVFLMLAGVPKTAARYVLPVVCALYFASAVGAAWIFAKPGWTWKIVGFTLPLLLVLGLEGSRCQSIYDSFKYDNRQKMAQWITLNLPKDALIAQESNGLLVNQSDSQSDSPYKVPQKLYEIGEEIQDRSLDALRSNGVQYVALVTDDRTESRRRKGKITKEGELAVQLSNELAAKCKKIWECTEKGTHVTNLKPNLAIYQLPTAETR